MGEPQSKNVPSALLSRPENDLLFNLVGNKCQVLACAVVDIFCVQHSFKDVWTKIDAGVATFINDSNKKSYFIRIYDVENAVMLLEQELHAEFKYEETSTFFHIFKADLFACETGLSFAIDNEAREFARVVRSKQMHQENQEDADLSALLEAMQLKERLTCKICMDNPVCVTLCPCGHLCTCQDCAESLSQCPICRRTIREKMHTFLS